MSTVVATGFESSFSGPASGSEPVLSDSSMTALNSSQSGPFGASLSVGYSRSCSLSSESKTIRTSLPLTHAEKAIGTHPLSLPLTHAAKAIGTSHLSLPLASAPMAIGPHPLFPPLTHAAKAIGTHFPDERCHLHPNTRHTNAQCYSQQNCTCCGRVGHIEASCWRLHPEIKQAYLSSHGYNQDGPSTQQSQSKNKE